MWCFLGYRLWDRLEQYSYKVLPDDGAALHDGGCEAAVAEFAIGVLQCMFLDGFSV